ncbi:MAG: PQQ-binding-like beta-propeller repeat protein [Kiritimatiellia bacterium]|jgi:outer membrane protein assembly factor BamB|nr:PQQ-binding-like beta-propeller repeat protein [Kiritimatiellia bacterium]MDP6848208.1 PQQ-binding-like beta-propeller repeat protein [Kiritimatiellia bacterium]
MNNLITTCLSLLLLAPALLPAAQDYKQALAEAKKAYDSGIENGNMAVHELIEGDPGNIDLAMAGLRLILERSRNNDGWRSYASERLLALQELGVVSWNESMDLDVKSAQLGADLGTGRRLSAGILLEELSERYPSTRQVNAARVEFRSVHGVKLPSYRFVPPHTGSLMELFALTRFGEDRWAEIRGADPATIAETIDKRIEKTSPKFDKKTGKVTVTLGKSSWEEKAGYLEDWTALDMHLRSQPAARLEALRDYQEKKLQEDPDNLTADALSVFRRFPWAETAHRRLLDYADVDLTRGRLQAAYRSFDDIRIRSANEDLRKRADDGCKLALSCMEKAESQAPDLASLKIQTVAPPPILPWRFVDDRRSPEYPELQVEDDHVILSGRRYLAAYGRSKTDLPKWIRTADVDIGPNKDCDSYGTVNLPGSYSPALIDGKVYARNLDSETAAVMKVIDLAGGTDLWTMGRYKAQAKGISTEAEPALDDYQQFLSKPVLVDGVLLYLSFELGARNRMMYLSVVAVDAETRNILWRSPIEIENDGKPKPNQYGVPPIVHKGFIYSVNSQLSVSCHDLRDGRLVWVHRYHSRGMSPALPRYVGSPVIIGKRLICSPGDSPIYTFALDLDTGRMIWANPDIYAIEQIGRHGNTVLVRDELTVAALSADDGKICWSYRCGKPIVGKVQLMGDRLYVPTEREMIVLSAGEGMYLGKRKWELKDGPPQAARIDGDRLFVVVNKPYLDPVKKVFNMSVSKAPELKFPLFPRWSLRGEHGKSGHIVPPIGSPLAGKMYHLYAGVLTCAEANPQGGIVWQRFVRQRVSNYTFTGEETVHPMFFGEMIVLRSRLANDQAFIAYNGLTGERLWSRHLHAGWSIQSSGDIIFCANNGGSVLCLDSKTGKTLWQQSFSKPGHRVGVTVSVQGSVMHVMQQRGHKIWHFVVNPRTGQRLNTYEDIRLGDEGKWRPCRIFIGSQGALLSFDGKLFSYKLDGKPVKHFRDASFVSVFATSDKYIVVEEHGNKVAVYKFGDAGYHEAPLSGISFSRNNFYFELEGERLICVSRGRRIILFDLQAKKIIHDSDVRETERLKNEKDEKKKHNGKVVYLLRHGDRLFVEMSPQHWIKAPPHSYFLDLQTGKTTDATGSVIFGSAPSWQAGLRIMRYSNGLIQHQSQPRRQSEVRFWSPKE